MRTAPIGSLPWVIIVAAAACSAACSPANSGDLAVAVRDSAGVQIVENPGDDAALPEWTLSAEPRVSIGVLEGEAAYQLDQVRAAKLHLDRVVVANGGSRELRFFDLEGRHVRTVGRKGGGPGEFEQPSWIGKHVGDSLVVYDIQQRRISLFDDDGDFGRSITPSFGAGSIAGRLADGSFIVRPFIFFGGPNEARVGLGRNNIGIVRLSADGQHVDTLAIYPGSEALTETGGTGGQRWVTVRTRPFGLSTQLAVGDSLIFVGTTDAWSIDVLDTAGTVRRAIRRAIPRRPVAEEDKAKYADRMLARITNENQRRESERFYSTVSYPEHLPAHGAMLMDTDGNLWVQDYLIARDDPGRWSVFAPDGRIAGRATTPPGMTIYEIGPDYVLGMIRDDLDVEHVVIHGLSRSPSREIADAATGP